MKRIVLFAVISVVLVANADAERGRKPCSGSKGGISHCTSGGQFVCNDGSLSQSKKICSGYGSGSGTAPERKKTSATATKKTTQKATTSHKKAAPQQVMQDDVPAAEPRKPTCAPLYMAHKPGYTTLPICTDNQY